MSDPVRTPQLPVPLQPVAAESGAEPASKQGRSSADSGFAAQTLGQGGQKRGLKGGESVLEAARKSYLHTQWSGPGDRRMPAGVIRKDEV